MAADELADDEAGQQFLLAAARAAAIVSTTSAPQPASQDLHAEWSEIYIDEATNVGTGAYVAMAEDQTRTPKFEQAIRRRLAGTADLVVLDIGTGPFCLLGLIAARAGAKRVYAVEANADAAAQARAAVTAASDVQPGTVVIVQGFSSDISLPESAMCSSQRSWGRSRARKVLSAPIGTRSDDSSRRQLIRVIHTAARADVCAGLHVLTSLLRPPFAAEDFAARQTGQPVRVGCRDAALQLLSPQLLEDYDLRRWQQLPSSMAVWPRRPPHSQPSIAIAWVRLRDYVSSSTANVWRLLGRSSRMAPPLPSGRTETRSGGAERHKPPRCVDGSRAPLQALLAGHASFWMAMRETTHRPFTIGRAWGRRWGGERAEEEEEAESHWQTVLPLLSSPRGRRRRRGASRIRGGVWSTGGRPSRYSLHGELRTTPPTATTCRPCVGQQWRDGRAQAERASNFRRQGRRLAAEDGRQRERRPEPPLLTRSLDAIDRGCEWKSARGHGGGGRSVRGSGRRSRGILPAVLVATPR